MFAPHRFSSWVQRAGCVLGLPPPSFSALAWQGWMLFHCWSTWRFFLGSAPLRSLEISWKKEKMKSRQSLRTYWLSLKPNQWQWILVPWYCVAVTWCWPQRKGRTQQCTCLPPSCHPVKAKSAEDQLPSYPACSLHCLINCGESHLDPEMQ